MNVILKKTIISLIAVSSIVGTMWPAGFAVGYGIKDREMCQKVKGQQQFFRYTAGGIMRGEVAKGTLRPAWYVDGLKKGMLYSLKQCFEQAGSL